MSDAVWNVGDQIIVREKTYSRGPAPVIPYVITKVARKHFYADATGDRGWQKGVAFEVDGGREKSNGTNYRAQAYTPEQWEAVQRREALDNRLWEHKVQFADHSSFGHSGRYLTDEELEQLLTVLDTAQRRIEAKDG